MRITVIGTGNVGRGIAARALAGGHHVAFVGTWIAKAQDVADELVGLGPVSASDLVRDGGLSSVDAGGLARARALEAAGYLHMAVQAALGTMFGSALKVLP
jgi:predicted dinucleotide-binding enzyme